MIAGGLSMNPLMIIAQAKISKGIEDGNHCIEARCSRIVESSVNKSLALIGDFKCNHLRIKLLPLFKRFTRGLDLPEVLQKRRQGFPCDPENQPRIDIEVLVSQNITEAHDPFPVLIGNLFL
jgi:hypothetical protein